MIPPFHLQEILHARSTSSVNGQANQLAHHFGLLGAIPTATRIKSLLTNDEYIQSGLYNSMGNYGASFLWMCESTNTWPEWISADEQCPENLAKKEAEEMKDVEAQLFRHPMRWTDKERERRRRESEDKVKEFLEEEKLRGDDGVDDEFINDFLATLLRFSELSGGPSQFSSRSALIYGMDFAVKHEQLVKAKEILRLLMEKWENVSGSMSLTCCRRAWRLFASSFVAIEFGLDAEKIRELGDLVVTTLEERLKNGAKRRPLADKSITELIKLCDKKAQEIIAKQQQQLADKEAEGGEERFPKRRRVQQQRQHSSSTSFLRPGLSIEAIRIEESRLGLTLPTEYTQFLQITNGFNTHALNTGAGNDPNADIPALNLPPLSKVIVKNAADFGIDELYFSLLPWEAGNISSPFAAPLFQNTRIVQLNDPDGSGDTVWFLNPDVVAQGREDILKAYAEGKADVRRILDLTSKNYCGGMEGLDGLEWGVMRWASWGVNETVWLSFKEYFEDVTWEFACKDERGIGWDSWDEFVRLCR